MTDTNPDNDDALLRRLNQLKKSSVRFSPHHSSSQGDPEEDIASRFLRLKGGLGGNSAPSRSTPATAATAVGDDEYETPWNPQDDLTIEELLAELGTEDQWTVDDGEEEANAEKLLGEAKKALGVSQESGHLALNDLSEDRGEGTEPKKPSEDEKDEEEAARYVAKVLEELDLEKRHGKCIDGGNSDGASANGSGDDLEKAAAFEFPSLPTSDPKRAKPDDDTTIASPQSFLPSAPTFTPSSKKKNKSSLPTYTDAEIATWCVICNDDAMDTLGKTLGLRSGDTVGLSIDQDNNNNPKRSRQLTAINELLSRNDTCDRRPGTIIGDKDIYSDGWEEDILPPYPEIWLPPTHTRSIIAGSFIKDSITPKEERTGSRAKIHRREGSFVKLRWETNVHQEVFRFVDIKDKHAKQSDFQLMKPKAELECEVVFKAKASITMAAKRYAYDLQVYKARRNKRCDRFPAAPLGPDPPEHINYSLEALKDLIKKEIRLTNKDRMRKRKGLTEVPSDTGTNLTKLDPITMDFEPNADTSSFADAIEGPLHGPDEEEYDSDIESDMIQDPHQIARAKFATAEYAEAGAFTRKLLDWYEEKQDTSLKDRDEMPPRDKGTLRALHSLAKIYWEKRDLGRGEDYCKMAVQGWKKALGPRNNTFLDSISLFAKIYKTGGDMMQAQAYIAAHSTEETQRAADYVAAATLLKGCGYYDIDTKDPELRKSLPFEGIKAGNISIV
ncbi:hypothetical protein FGG08_006809 [Glutinoglossum americanum]|uniref:Uncharacterized protein n=1 Tax=Glutinoglossum americanum TaxID=1670608 RepID=A0A9P8I0J5_9PEZI|nr:hypothetical protein FGG08_006809 [Glutinoglossum americanum]